MTTTHRLATKQDIHTVARLLQETLGQRLTAYCVGVSQPKQVGSWASGQTPREDAERRLRHLYEVVATLQPKESDATIRAWLLGANPQLNDEAPADGLHEQDAKAVIRAARAFVDLDRLCAPASTPRSAPLAC